MEASLKKQTNRQETKIELYDPAILFLSIYPEQNKNSISKKNSCTPMFKAILSTIAKVWK